MGKTATLKYRKVAIEACLLLNKKAQVRNSIAMLVARMQSATWRMEERAVPKMSCSKTRLRKVSIKLAPKSMRLRKVPLKALARRLVSREKLKEAAITQSLRISRIWWEAPRKETLANNG